MGLTLSMLCRADHWRKGLTQPDDVPAMMKEVHPDDEVAIGVSRERGRGFRFGSASLASRQPYAHWVKTANRYLRFTGVFQSVGQVLIVLVSFL
jgi:hypothetical protein